jgi:acetate kinase
MTDVILVLNAGSSSIKFSIFALDGEEKSLALVYRGEMEGIGTQPRFVVRDATGKRLAEEQLPANARGHLSHEATLAILLGWIEGHAAGLSIVAAGHRVVHGGELFSAPMLIDHSVISQLERFVPLAPLHQPHNIAAIKALVKIKPDLPQVACFDTAFHRTQSPIARAFALPRDLSKAGVKRYGFHGLSYEYIAHVLPDFVGAASDGSVVVAHLGNGVSMCAMRGRKSVATTMGFTALEGLPMGTRCGAIDPGVILYLISERGMDVAQVTDLLYHKSGLLGVSGISSDMRELLESHSPYAAEAVDLFVYRIGRELGSLAATLGGLDGLVFTAGIGEHAPAIRKRVCEDAQWLGVRLDEAANLRGGPRISHHDSAVSVWVIPTDEELMIARHTVACLPLAPFSSRVERSTSC